MIHVHLTVYFFSHIALGPIINFRGMYGQQKAHENKYHFASSNVCSALVDE